MYNASRFSTGMLLRRSHSINADILASQPVMWNLFFRTAWKPKSHGSLSKALSSSWSCNKSILSSVKSEDACLGKSRCAYLVNFGTRNAFPVPVTKRG